jgi:hypothetical protein
LLLLTSAFWSLFLVFLLSGLCSSVADSGLCFLVSVFGVFAFRSLFFGCCF